MRVTLSAERINGEQSALLIERKDRIVGSVAAFRIGTGAVRRKWSQACVGRIVKSTVELC
jgi:hypothetical protein